MTETEPLHIRVRREFLSTYPGDSTCGWCKGSGYRVNTAEEDLVERCDCMTGRPSVGDGRTLCDFCEQEYFKHNPAPNQKRDSSACYSIIVHCDGGLIQI